MKANTLVSVVVLVATAIVPMGALSQPRLPTPTPIYRNWNIVNVPPQGGTPARFASGQQDGNTLTIPAVLFKPVGAPKGAVIIVNATPGWNDFREGHYGRALSSAGYAVLALDTYGPRGVTGAQENNAQLSTHAQALDAFAARRFLISIGYAPDRMAIMGTGRGGTIALLAADRTFVRNERERFALAISISAGCIFHPREPKPAARIFMAIGEKDRIAGVEPCKILAKEYEAAGGDVTVKLYPGASSGFDGHPYVLQTFSDPLMETFVDCNVPVERDGRSNYLGKTFAESDTGGLIAEMRKSCIKKGGSGWTNVTQKANLTLDLIEFLDSSFRF